MAGVGRTKIIYNLYDSHVHWLATGEHTRRLSLKFLKSPHEVQNLEILPHHYRGEWLIGWGWDQTRWSPAEFPDREILDRKFSDKPVVFIRTDGHALWLNSEALKRVSKRELDSFVREKSSDQILKRSDGTPTGVFLDHAMSLVTKLIPPQTPLEIYESLKNGVRVFNQAGFTHIRDLSCSETQWQQAQRLFENGELTLAVEQFFDAEPPDRFDSVLRLALHAKKEASKLIRVQGIKIYYDGALGSEGALLSHPYGGCRGKGLRLLTPSELREMTQKTWEQGLDIAVHVIGDQAAHEVAQTLGELWQSGAKGRLHLEHAEMMRPETARLLHKKPVTCHMQPCHWLSDRRWLDEKLQDLKSTAFPWALLQDFEIRFDFGSDSPIEEPNYFHTIEALRKSAQQGIAPLKGSPDSFHRHPDPNWVMDTYTNLTNTQILQVVFQGRELL